MPGKVKVKIISGRNLPVMDRSSDTTDAYVEIKLGSTTYKTDVCRKSLHPHWNSEWYRFEVDDSELQDEPLQIRLMDHDTYSANDAIGKVYLDLNPLLLPAAGSKHGWPGESNTNHEHSSNSVMSGWIPVYDTMHGIRGEVNIVVKVELFSDFNRFRQSSCGIQFFCSKSIPYGYFAQIVHGFVEELIVNDDPEYQWIDKIRTPRASNEARQTLFFKLSGELQRKIGVKALDLGGNAVIGYCQCFDLEGESGIVARGIGTAVTLIKLVDIPQVSCCQDTLSEDRVKNYLRFVGVSAGFRLNSSANNAYHPYTHRRSLPPPIVPLEIYNPRYTELAKRLYDDNPNQFLRHTRSNPTLNQNHHVVKILLKQEEMRGTPSSSIGQKIKNLKYSSQNMLSKKMSALKARLGDSGIEEVGEAPIVEEKKRTKPFKFKRTVSNDSSVMAQLLARSVLHAHSSLTCILESQDSTQSYEDEPMSMSESVIPSSNATEDVNKPASLLAKTVSEPSLAAQNASLNTAGSSYNNSSSGSDESSSSDDDDENNFDLNPNFDTVSNIVKNVEILEHQRFADGKFTKLLSKQYSLPAMGLADNQDEVDDNNPFIFPIYDDTNDDILQMGENLKHFDTNENENISAPLATVESSSEDDVPLLPPLSPPLPMVEAKTIIPPVMVANTLKRQSLMRTAMQTMLLEKVSMVGTYTPPLSPTSPTSLVSMSSSSNSIPSNKHLAPSNRNLPRASTSASLSEWGRRHETVLGAPFDSVRNIKYNLRRLQSHPCLSTGDMGETEKYRHNECASDTRLNNPVKSATNVRPDVRYKFSFSNIIGRSSEDSINLKRGVSHEHLQKRKLSFLHLSRRQSHDPASNLKKVKSDEFNKSRFRFSRQRKSSENEASSPTKGFMSNIFGSKSSKVDGDSTLKKHGLLGTALGNVVMETVQDILATSQTEKKQPQAESPRFLPSSILLTANNCSPVPLNTETGGGTVCGDINMHASLTPSLRNDVSPPPTAVEPNLPEPTHHRAESVGAKATQSPAKVNNSVPCIHRRSSESDLSVTPKGNSLTGSDRSGGANNGYLMKAGVVPRATVPQENFDMLEYPFLTMHKYPPGFIQQLGGAVSARSVKLLERISNLEEPESRDTWWSEIRMEIRSHARALNCNAVLGYAETTSICEDVCVLSASGTAAVIGLQYSGEMGDSVGGLPVIPKHGKDVMTTSLDRNEFEKEKIQKVQDTKTTKNNNNLPESPDHEVFPTQMTISCTICHLPYNTNNVPIRATVLKCGNCKSGKVPDVLIATIEAPDGVPVIGRGCFIQSFVCRQLKDLKGETNAKEISDGLPFLEYELHRLLVNKLKIKGMNSIFGLKIRISIGEKMLVGLATGTAIFLAPLPCPVLPKLVSDRTSDEKKLADLQKLLNETVKKNREIYQLKIEEIANGKILSDDESEEDQIPVDLALGGKDCCILEVDDPEDAEIVNLLMEERPPDGFHVVNTELVPGLEELEIVKNLQMFKQIYRAKFHPPYNFDLHFHRLLQSVYFKLRRMVPCALCDLQFRVDLPETDEIQLCVLGMALGLGDPQKLKNKKKGNPVKRTDVDLIFNLDEDQIPENSVHTQNQPSNYLTPHSSTRQRQRSPLRNRIQTTKQRHTPYRERHGVDITPLSYVPGGKIEHYLGNLNFFFIRETTSIREEGGLSGFIHSFVTEVLAIVRAHVTALGGNAMVAYFMTECILNHSLHKNQGQCLINVGGDVVFVSYFKEDP